MVNDVSVVDLVIGAAAGAGVSVVFSVVDTWRRLRSAPKASEGVQLTVAGVQSRVIHSVAITFEPSGGPPAGSA
jgi:hypothetical protein